MGYINRGGDLGGIVPAFMQRSASQSQRGVRVQVYLLYNYWYNDIVPNDVSGYNKHKHLFGLLFVTFVWICCEHV